MKFAESLQILSSTSPGAYARAFRAIGQDLSSLFPEKLSIEIEGDDFIARGQCPRNRFETSLRIRQGKSFKEHCLEVLSRDLLAPASQELPANVEFSRIYTPDEITRIDEIGISRRSQAGKLPDIRSLGEILRTIGRLIDGQDGQLIRLCRDARGVTYEFWDRDGKSHEEKLGNLELYRLQKSFYGKRGTAVVFDPWKNSQ